MHYSLVYTAGPITGLNYAGATDWRKEVEDALFPLQTLSPMRAKEHLAGVERITGSYEDMSLASSRGIITRDRFDVMRCDLVFMNLLGAKMVSIGTMIEAGWADASRTPVVVVMEDGNIHSHTMLMEIAGFVVPDLEAAINITRGILL